MRIRWRGLELPSRVVRDEQVSTDTYGKFSAEPFERGFGTTVGNSLRRILLSSLEGAAVTHIKLKGAEHEFSSLHGVMEDVTDIILNVKSLIVKLDADEPKDMPLVEASKIVRKHLNPFVQYFELGQDTASDDAIAGLREATKATMDPDLQQKLDMSIQELDLSVRANNCLESAKIGAVRDLVKKTDADLLKVRSFGKTSLREVKRKLADLGLSLGMDLDNIPTPGSQAYTSPDEDEAETAEAATEGQ